MNIHQLHIADKNSVHAGMQDCTPCETSPRPETARYWPKVRMQRRYQNGMPDERLSIEIANPCSDIILRHVKIAFLSTGPQNHLKNGNPVVKFAPTHGIEFGDIAHSSDTNKLSSVTRDIIMIENQANPDGRQIYAGICFTACTKTGEVKHYGYLLFKSNVLPAQVAVDQAA
ncbi:MAG: hypothetical protein BWK73_05955 [Thiothrix lacustris]|uniref:Uncharacterized protein n=1 Tax=Thiothrix lacustris TaxID=525917 RepID=A0A1Y1QWU0_9GAMM|nr:MAG: hypothetical protein BWK73_05955 [Thiothrix lacustris]